MKNKLEFHGLITLVGTNFEIQSVRHYGVPTYTV